jgi:hypothetical protein
MKHNLLQIFITKSAAVLLIIISLFPIVPAKDYSNFSHRTKEHRKNCNSCHQIPTPNWASARSYPDVADYPGHASCINCHRAQFFDGPKPSICSICHVVVSPRGKARFKFPLNNRKGEFETIFPHNLHQDIIALNTSQPIAVAHFVNASFNLDDEKKDEKPKFNNCAICHVTPKILPNTKARKPERTLSLVAAAHSDPFKPTAEFFKNAPQNHASCFNCHYQGQRPTRTECASCHRLTGEHFDSKTISRYSLKFNHEDKNHRNKDCTTCHIRITQVSDLRLLVDADVPILTCSTSSCHASQLKDELTKRSESLTKKEAVFECAYCHTSPIGSYQVSPSHEESR